MTFLQCGGDDIMEWLMSWWNSYEAVNMFRLLFASFFSGLIGIEREIHGRSAGFRTHLLVGVSACLMMIVSEYFFKKYGGLSSNMTVRMDPAALPLKLLPASGFLGPA